MPNFVIALNTDPYGDGDGTIDMARVTADSYDSPITSITALGDVSHYDLIKSYIDDYPGYTVGQAVGQFGIAGMYREVNDDGTPVEQEEREFYIASLDVWAHGENVLRTFPVAVLSVQTLDKPAREAVPILNLGIYLHMVDQFRSDPRGVGAVAQDLGLSLLEQHGAATVFGGEIYEESSAQAVAERLFPVPPRGNKNAAARRVLNRG